MAERAKTSQSSKRGLNRRAFLTAAGAGAVASTAPGVIPYVSIDAHAQERWDHESDIVVVGSGAAGGTAAAKALDLGQTVTVLEKAPGWGGTTAKSGGVYWIPNNTLMRARGIDDPRDDALRYMARLAQPELYNENAENYGLPQLNHDLLAVFYDRGPEIIDDLQGIGALSSKLLDDPDGDPQWFDYAGHIPENKAPLGRELVPAQEDGTTGFGIHLAGHLRRYIESNNANILMRHRVTAVVTNHLDEIVGVRAESAGEPRMIRARKGVIFGSGGFTHNASYRQHYLLGPIFGGCAVPTNEGDFIRIGQAVRASLGNMSQAWWGELLLEHALQTSSVGAIMWGPPGNSMFLVNKYGVRVVNETALYNERTQVHFEWDPYHYEYPNLILMMIWDQATHEESAGRFPIPPAGAEAGYVIQANTLESLADRIDQRLEQLGDQINHFRLDASFRDNLPATTARFNEFARDGRDPDFHRGENPSGWFLHQGFNYSTKKLVFGEPGETMRPLARQGPYYAALIGAGTLDTKGGPVTNTQAQILDIDNQPINGLYGAGNCVASPAGRAYFSGGATIGPAIVFGYIAAEHAAQSPVKGYRSASA